MPNYEDFSVTESAITKIQSILQENQVLKITVEPGGCKGFEYKFNIENYEENKKNFYIFQCNNLPIVIIDNVSLKMMKNSTLDYEKELIGEKFTIKNPNSSTSCSCGSSFTT